MLSAENTIKIQSLGKKGVSSVEMATYHNSLHHGVVAFVSSVHEGLMEDFDSLLPVVVGFELLGLLKGGFG